MDLQNNRQRYTTQNIMQMLSSPEGIDQLDNDHALRSSEELFTQQLRRHLRVHGVSSTELGAKTSLSRSFIYQILGGDRIPGRDVILRMAFVLGLGVEETQSLLRAARRGQLYPRIRRDALLIHALNRHMPLEEAEALLAGRGEQPLL